MGLNPAAFMDVCLLCRVSNGLRDGFIVVSEESYWICLSIVCDQESSKNVVHQTLPASHKMCLNLCM